MHVISALQRMQCNTHTTLRTRRLQPEHSIHAGAQMDHIASVSTLTSGKGPREQLSLPEIDTLQNLPENPTQKHGPSLSATPLENNLHSRNIALSCDLEPETQLIPLFPHSLDPCPPTACLGAGERLGDDFDGETGGMLKTCGFDARGSADFPLPGVISPAVPDEACARLGVARDKDALDVSPACLGLEERDTCQARHHHGARGQVPCLPANAAESKLVLERQVADDLGEGIVWQLQDLRR